MIELFLLLKPLPKLTILDTVQTVSLLVEKVSESDLSSYILGAGEGRDPCGKKPSPS